MVEIVNWIVTVLALLGAYLNSRQDVRGFIFWIITNGYLGLYNLYLGHLPQAFLFLAYLLITINGLRSWKR